MICMQRKILPFDIIPLGNSKYLDIDYQKYSKSTPDQLTFSILSYLPAKQDSSETNSFKTYVNLKCNLDMENPAVLVTKTSRYGLNVTIEAKEVCHLCGEDDYLVSYSGCVNNVVIQSYVRLDSCASGIHKKDSTGFCLVDTFNFFLVVILGGAVLFVALFSGSCIVICCTVSCMAFFVYRTVTLQNAMTKFKQLDEDFGEKKADNQEDELNYSADPEKAKKRDEDDMESTPTGGEKSQKKKDIEMKNTPKGRIPNNSINDNEEGADVDLDLDDI